MQQKKMNEDWMGKLDELLFDMDFDEYEDDDSIDDKRKKLLIAS